MQRKLGIIAGLGQMPSLMAAEAHRQGYEVYTAALEGLVEPEAARAYSDHVASFGVGKLGGLITHFKEHGVSEAVFGGKVPKTVIFGKGFMPDWRAVKFLFRLSDYRDDTMMDAISREFEGEGIKLLDMREFCRALLTVEGAITRQGLSKREQQDVEFGYKMAKAVGRLDIGQTIVVKERAVMAVEAAEGTDEAIRRGGRLAEGGAVVVKVSRPNQDMRFDIPTVGLATLDAMKDSACRVLAVEAGKSILLDREEFIRRAEDAGISVIGYASTEEN